MFPVGFMLETRGADLRGLLGEFAQSVKAPTAFIMSVRPSA
jgi:hypothetical protein